MVKNDAAEDKHDKETNSDNKPTSEHDNLRPLIDGMIGNAERNRYREIKREKESELERYEREAEWERIKKEREQRRRIDAAELEYEAHLKEWEYREKVKERNRQYDKVQTFNLIVDTIPKTKEELFSYEINWAVYDKHQLHERMRPWISKKIT